MADWWESAQPRGAKPLPAWIKLVFVLATGVLLATFWLASVEWTIAVASILGAFAYKLIVFYTRKMDRPVVRRDADDRRERELASSEDVLK
ncbi:MAG: hypothetical protein ACXVEF_26660 [Polyangiales bacterium]